jgi:Zn-dependent protease
MFGPIQPTPYDLTFSLFGIPVRVLPWFWLVSVLMGFDLLSFRGQGLALLLGWVGVVFVSILIHELGHALVARWFGYPPRIMLYHFGGLAMYQPSWDYTTAKAILISVAGPGAGFLFYGLVWLVKSWAESRGAQVSLFGRFVLSNLEYVNLWWGLINLLPVHPLDGGQVCREVLMSLNPRQGMRWTLQVGIVVGAAVAAYGFYRDERYVGMLFGALALGCYMELQQRRLW